LLKLQHGKAEKGNNYLPKDYTMQTLERSIIQKVNAFFQKVNAFFQKVNAKLKLRALRILPKNRFCKKHDGKEIKKLAKSNRMYKIISIFAA
jgi:hypothetical protein